MKIFWILLWLTSGSYSSYDIKVPYPNGDSCSYCEKYDYKNERWKVFDSSTSLVQCLKDSSVPIKDARVFISNESGITVIPMDILIK